MMQRDPIIKVDRDNKGFTLVELLVSMAVGMMLLAGFYSLFTLQNKRYDTEDQLVELHQNVGAAMQIIITDVRLAGYDPESAGGFFGVTCNQDQLELKADVVDPPNGEIDAVGENIIYRYDDETRQITRHVVGDENGEVPLIENVEAFVFDFLDLDGNATAFSSAVRQIRISITGRTANRDPNFPLNDGFRTWTLTSLATPRNLFY
jgi:type IV pilus assembly protein PilW